MLSALLFWACLSQETLDDLLKKVDTRASEVQVQRAGGKKSDTRIGALVSRHQAGRDQRAYVVATYSFEHVTRDDAEKTHNDWDLLYGNGPGDGLDVCTVTDDLSLIWDLGEVDFDTPRIARPAPEGLERATAAKGHVYVIHTLDTDTDLWAKMQILEQQAGEWIIFRWELIKDPSVFLSMERRPETLLKGGTVRLQLRGGAGGGNPRRVFLTGKTNTHVRFRDAKPLDMSGELAIDEEARAYAEGGYVPQGKVWIVRSIQYEGLAKGDSNGPGEFILRVDDTQVARVGNDPASFKREWTGRIVVRPGREARVFLEIANSSKGNVILKGVLWPEKFADVEKFEPLAGDMKRKVDAALDELDAEEISRRDGGQASLLEMGPPIVDYLRSLDTKGRSNEFRARLGIVLRQIWGE